MPTVDRYRVPEDRSDVVELMSSFSLAGCFMTPGQLFSEYLPAP